MEASRGDVTAEDESAEYTVSPEQLFTRRILWEDALKKWFHGIGKRDGRRIECVWWRDMELETKEHVAE